MKARNITIIKIMPVLSCFLTVSLISCSSIQDSFPSPDDSIDTEVALRKWNENEKLAQNLFLHTILPEMELPTNTIVSYTKSTNIHASECYFQVLYGTENKTISNGITTIFDTTYGAHQVIDNFVQWHIAIENEEFYSTINLNTEFGYFVATPHANTWRGCKEYLNTYFSHFYEGRKFDDLYPSFPAIIEDTDISFYDGGSFERAYVVIVLNGYNLHEAWETKRLVSYSGWHIYPWIKEGVENTKVYTKEGVSGGLMYDLSQISKNNLLIHWSAGFENIDYSIL